MAATTDPTLCPRGVASAMAIHQARADVLEAFDDFLEKSARLADELRIRGEDGVLDDADLVLVETMREKFNAAYEALPALRAPFERPGLLRRLLGSVL